MPEAAIQLSNKDEWYTPKVVIDFFGPFDYDPATTKERAELLGIKKYDTIHTDGLKTDWTQFDRIWVNPPFTLKFDFLEKAVASKKYVCFLLPTEAITTRKFQDIFTKYKSGYTMWIPKGRVKFEDKNGVGKSPAFGSVILELNKKKKTIRHWDIYGKTC